MAKAIRPVPEPRPTRPKETSSGASPPAANERPSKTKAPKPRRDVGLAWLVLVGLLLLAAIPMVIELSRPAIWTETEAFWVAVSTETYRRKTPIKGAQTSSQAWTPVYEGASRWDLPPGTVWLHLVAYPGLTPDGILPGATADNTLATRARWSSLAMALLFIAAVFWAGHSIGGVTTGALSALVAMSMPLVIGFGRHATPHSAALAFSTLSIAGALWAMRPLRAPPGLLRQLIGWLVCGLGLALAALTAGPTAVPATLLCTIALAMVCPRRIGHIMGLLASTASAALLLTPWILHVHGQDPDIWRTWVDQLAPDFGSAGFFEILRRAGWRLSLAATASGLWLVWLVPAVSQPFSTSTGNARRKMLLGWVWLITATGLLTLAPGPTRLAGLLLAIAPASISVGLVMQQFHDLSAEARHARLWLICRWIGASIMLFFAIALPTLAILLQGQPDIGNWLTDFDHKLLAPMHWTFYGGAGIALFLIGILAIRFAYGNHPGRTTACLAVWLLVAYALVAIPISRGELLNRHISPPVTDRPQPQRLPTP